MRLCPRVARTRGELHPRCREIRGKRARRLDRKRRGSNRRFVGRADSLGPDVAVCGARAPAGIAATRWPKAKRAGRHSRGRPDNSAGAGTGPGAVAVTRPQFGASMVENVLSASADPPQTTAECSEPLPNLSGICLAATATPVPCLLINHLVRHPVGLMGGDRRRTCSSSCPSAPRRRSVPTN